MICNRLPYDSLFSAEHSDWELWIQEYLLGTDILIQISWN